MKSSVFEPGASLYPLKLIAMSVTVTLICGYLGEYFAHYTMSPKFIYGTAGLLAYVFYVFLDIGHRATHEQINRDHKQMEKATDILHQKIDITVQNQIDELTERVNLLANHQE